MAKITVIGSCVTDIVATMDKYPEAGETILGKTVGFYPGGKGANQCVSIARLLGDVEMIGMLGNDGNGKTFRELFKNEGIKSDYVFETDVPTAISQIQINSEGQNRICVIPSANYEFSFEHLDKVDEILKNTTFVVLQLELRLDVTMEIIRRAHAYGVKIILNPAPAVKLDKEILSMVDYLTPNETELSIISGLPASTDDEIIKAAKKLLDSGVKNVIPTLGPKGALIANKDMMKFVPTFDTRPIDTVAAGDSFNGALAVALSEGKSLEEAVIFANAMGSLTITVKGAIPSLHTRKEVEDFMKTHSNDIVSK